jgi:hypothetical protein
MEITGAEVAIMPVIDQGKTGTDSAYSDSDEYLSDRGERNR